MTALLVMTLFVFTDVKVSFACDCGFEPDYVKALEKSDVVFDGIVSSKKAPSRTRFGETSSAALVAWTFQVNGSWKGEIPEKYTVYSAQASPSCGYEFEVGKRYIVFGSNDYDKMKVSLCSNTMQLTDASFVHEELSAFHGKVAMDGEVQVEDKQDEVVTDKITNQQKMNSDDSIQAGGSKLASNELLIYGAALIFILVIANNQRKNKNRKTK